MSASSQPLNVTIACGGTGGHLFPGLAVAERLALYGARVTLMVSAKEVDQLAVKTAGEMKIVTLPAVGLTGRRLVRFINGFRQSYAQALQTFRSERPHAVLAMGGFTSAPPILAGKRCGACTFLHESNTIPGRANRWLSWIVDHSFVGFPQAATRLHAKKISVTGTPVRSKFQPMDARACRIALGLEAERPLVLVMGGSQGAHSINELIQRSMELLMRGGFGWQWLHLSGPADVDSLRKAYGAAGLPAKVYPFLADMELAMGAATAAVCRAGASSLAELAAVQLPALVLPYPAATDNHQYFNALAFEKTGAAKMLNQKTARPEDLVRLVTELMQGQATRYQSKQALAAWHRPHAAEQIAQLIIESSRTEAAIGTPLSKPASGDSSANAEIRPSRQIESLPFSGTARRKLDRRAA